MKYMLIGFGGCTVMMNTLFYFAFRDTAKWHGDGQLALAIVGAFCFVAGLCLKSRNAHSF